MQDGTNIITVVYKFLVKNEQEIPDMVFYLQRFGQ